MLTAVLVSFHLLALLAALVFLASRSALLRPEARAAREAILPALRRLDRIYWAALLTLGLSGLLLVLFGPGGAAYYGKNILFTLMALGWLVLVLLAGLSSRRLAGLAAEGAQAPDRAFARLRSSLMGQGHLMGVIVILGVFLAFGYGGH